MTERVMISGMGVAWHVVRTLDEYWSMLNHPPVPTPLTVVMDEADGLFDFRGLRRTTPAARLAVLAGLRAWADCGTPKVAPQRAGVVVGAGFDAIDWDAIVDQAVLYERFGPKGLEPLAALTGMPNLGAALIAARQGWQGPSMSVGAGCTSSTTALCVAVDLIRAGRTDVLLVGGSCHVATRHLDPRATLKNLRVHTTAGVSRPFSASASGFVHSEGAAFVVLESAAALAARGGVARAEIRGAATVTDVGDLVAPTSDGGAMAHCYRAALADASAHPGDITLVNPHGSGTPSNDRAEEAALLAVFGGSGPAVSPSKPATGHLASGAGAAELVATVLAMQRGSVPPTAHTVEPRVGCPLDLVVGAPRPFVGGLAVTSNLGLGGHHAALVVGLP